MTTPDDVRGLAREWSNAKFDALRPDLTFDSERIFKAGDALAVALEAREKAREDSQAGEPAHSRWNNDGVDYCGECGRWMPEGTGRVAFDGTVICKGRPEPTPPPAATGDDEKLIAQADKDAAYLHARNWNDMGFTMQHLAAALRQRGEELAAERKRVHDHAENADFWLRAADHEKKRADAAVALEAREANSPTSSESSPVSADEDEALLRFLDIGAPVYREAAARLRALREQLADEEKMGDLHRDINRRSAVALWGPIIDGKCPSWSGMPEEIRALRAERDADRESNVAMIGAIEELTIGAGCALKYHTCGPDGVVREVPYQRINGVFEAIRQRMIEMRPWAREAVESHYRKEILEAERNAALASKDEAVLAEREACQTATCPWCAINAPFEPNGDPEANGPDTDHRVEDSRGKAAFHRCKAIAIRSRSAREE